MPKITDINSALERKVDLSPFFGEEAYVTIKRMGKYQFTLLLNKGRGSYSSKLHELMTEWKREHPEEKLEGQAYDDLKKSISVEEAEQRISLEAEVDRGYFEHSIMRGNHNFTDENDNLLEIEGGWFYDTFASLVDSEGKTLNDVIVSAVVDFNYKGIVLGESIPSK